MRAAIVSLTLLLSLPAALQAQAPHPPTAEERAGIEKLHQQDVAATVAADPALLCALWADDAVRLEEGSAPAAGKQAICAADASELASRPKMKVTYQPSITSIEVIGEVAYEWGTFEASSQLPTDDEAQVFHGKLLRVLRKQPDGSWKFSRVMWNLMK